MTQRHYRRSVAVVFVALAPLLVIYLMAAFVLWEADPAMWSEEAGFFIALTGMGSAGMAVTAFRGADMTQRTHQLRTAARQD